MLLGVCLGGQNEEMDLCKFCSGIVYLPKKDKKGIIVLWNLRANGSALQKIVSPPLIGRVVKVIMFPAKIVKCRLANSLYRYYIKVYWIKILQIHKIGNKNFHVPWQPNNSEFRKNMLCSSMDTSGYYWLNNECHILQILAMTDV